MVENVEMEKARTLAMLVFTLLALQMATIGRSAVYGASSPVASFTCSSSTPSVDEAVTFDASGSYDPDGFIVDYQWDFGDGATGEGVIVSHKFSEPKVLPVTLTVRDNSGLCNSHTVIIVVVHHVNIGLKLDVQVSVGQIHFNGEIAEFYILISYLGKPVENATVNATLYFNATAYANLTDSVQNVSPGLYRVPYAIPLDAPAGTYAMVVEATKKTNCQTLYGAALATFLLSPTLTNWNAWIIQLQEDMATIKTDVGIIKTSLEDINAKLVSIDGRIATIETNIGIIKADADVIKLQLKSVEGNIATISTVLGEINGTITSIKESIAEIKTSIGNIQTDISAINATIKDINGTLAIITTNIGEIQINLNQINATLVSLNGTTATIETSLGTIQTSIEKINAKIANIEGNITTINTTLGDINGTLISISDDIATIKTDIGEIKISIQGLKAQAPTAIPVWIILAAIIIVGAIIAATILIKRRK